MLVFILPPHGWEELRGDRRCGRAVSASSACHVILSYTKGPGLASAGPRPQVLPRPGVSQPLQVMKARLPPPLPECLGSQRPHCEGPAFISCIRLARLTAASLGPEEDARSGVCCQGFSCAIPVNSDSPELPAGENKGQLCPSPFSLGQGLGGGC